MQSALKILAGAGVEASLVLTQSSADAAEHARKAILEGCDTVFACGGDGTIHDVLQGMAGTRVALGIIPMGTANALARDLGLPLDPSEAVRAALDAEPRRIALGLVRVRGFNGDLVARYFSVAVGVGVDAHLFYKLNAAAKQRLGMAAYYVKAWHLWFSHRMERFVVEWSIGESDAGQCTGATEMLAVRIRNFGGVLRELAPGASLDRDDLRVVVCSTSSRLAYLLYVTRGLLGLKWKVPGVELMHSEQVQCGYSSGPGAAEPPSKVYVEADGELVGTLPAEVSIVRDALTILMPKKSAH
jgi:YegS/Rv2252/BmrU family lipid kinase